MGYGEAYRLLTLLAADPSSQTGAALQGWSHPASREFLALADSYDLAAAVASKRRPKPYPRPWESKDRRTFGRGRGMTPAALDALIAAQQYPPPARPRDARGRFVALT